MEPIPTELIVRRVSALLESPMGHPYIEAEVDGGTVAFWGSAGNLSHIQEIQATATPFRIVCDCIKSNWNQHDLWVHERHEIYAIEVLRDPPLDSSPESSPAMSGMGGHRVQLSCRKCGHLGQFTADAFRELMETYGVKAERTIPLADLGRLRCQECGAHAVRQTTRGFPTEQTAVTAVTRARRFETCPACSGDGGPDSRCWKCWGRGFLDAAADAN